MPGACCSTPSPEDFNVNLLVIRMNRDEPARLKMASDRHVPALSSRSFENFHPIQTATMEGAIPILAGN